MTAFILQRLISTVPIVLIVGIITFFLVQLSPGDPALFYVSPDAPPAEIDRMRERMGLNQPVHLRFVTWGSEVLQGNLGISFHQNRPVLEGFLDALPVTLWLAFYSLVIALIVGIPLGLLSALKPNGKVDRFSSIFVLLGMSMPNFWLGMLLVLLFAVTLGLLPAQGYDPTNAWTILRSLLLPAIALGYSQAALIARMTRSSMLEVMRQDYVQTARAKGLRTHVVLGKHAFGNALNPIITVVGLAVGSLAAGSAVVEVVFNLPGIGRLIVDSIMRRDYPMIQGILILTAGMIILVNLITDLLYAMLDPRISYD